MCMDYWSMFCHCMIVISECLKKKYTIKKKLITWLCANCNALFRFKHYILCSKWMSFFLFRSCIQQLWEPFVCVCLCVCVCVCVCVCMCRLTPRYCMSLMWQVSHGLCGLWFSHHCLRRPHSVDPLLYWGKVRPLMYKLSNKPGHTFSTNNPVLLQHHCIIHVVSFYISVLLVTVLNWPNVFMPFI